MTEPKPPSLTHTITFDGVTHVILEGDLCTLRNPFTEDTFDHGEPHVVARCVKIELPVDGYPMEFVVRGTTLSIEPKDSRPLRRTDLPLFHLVTGSDVEIMMRG